MVQRRTREEVKESILAACVRLFLEQGYGKTTLAQISKAAGVSISSFQNIFVNKEGVLLELTQIMFAGQFDAARNLGGQELTPVFVYAAETAIQLTLTELNENIREVYVAAYSNPAAAEYICKRTADELEQIFLPYNPECTASDFYEFEMGSSGIMRGFMARKCDRYFTLEKKLTKFLTMALRAYNVPKEEIDQALAFVLSLDIRAISEGIMHRLFALLAMHFHFDLTELEQKDKDVIL